MTAAAGSNNFGDAPVIAPDSIPGVELSLEVDVDALTTEAGEPAPEFVTIVQTAWWKVEIPPDLTSSGEPGALVYVDALESDITGGVFDPLQVTVFAGDIGCAIDEMTQRGHADYGGSADNPAVFFANYDEDFYVQVGMFDANPDNLNVNTYGIRAWYEADSDEPPPDSTATLQIIERYGDAVYDRIALTTFIDLLASDQPSSVGFQSSPLSVSNDGSTVYSYERWIRLQFVLDDELDPVEIANVRVWFPSLALEDGWSLKYGIADTYQQPTRSPSSIAATPAPTTDPGLESMFENTGSVGERVCQYLVLQASVSGDAPTGPMQGLDGEDEPVPLNYHIAWTEI